MSSNKMEDIAVVGFSLKFPQEADSVEGFWDMMMDQRCAVTQFPEDRLNFSAMYHLDKNRDDSISFQSAHFLKESVATFDAPFFSISASEAAGIDPQQRLLLETSYRALENAGMPIEKVSGSKTSVYTGCFTSDWKDNYCKDPEQQPSHGATGVIGTLLANRLSWFFNFKGSSANIDTACSSSLVALDIACNELRAHVSDMGIAAGCNLMLGPDMMHLLSGMNMVSPDGKCFSFDHRANGYGRGEGIAVVVLKRVSDAIRDNDPIRAVIRGTGANQDGYTPGITTPSSSLQEVLIRETYEKAGLSLEDTAYFEAHGTGTQVGDPIEINAVGRVFREHRPAYSPLYVGAVKSNIGHLEGASGLAGLIKAILALERGIIPPNTNFEKPNPRIDEEFLRIKFPQVATNWPSAGLRRASINSFGFGGTNAHVIVDDALHYLESRGLRARHNTSRSPLGTPPTLYLGDTVSGDALENNSLDGDTLDGGSEDGISSALKSPITDSPIGCSPNMEINHKWSQEVSLKLENPKLLVFSSADADGLTRTASTYSQYFRSTPVHANNFSDLAYTLDSRRSFLPWKAFIVAKSSSPSLKTLETAMPKAVHSLAAPKLAWVFTGQGAQWAKMGLELMSYPVFRSSLERSSTVLGELGAEWDLMDELQKDTKNSRVDSPEFSQPICTALQVALVDLLRTWNISPTATIGHSSGEIAAAYSISAISHHAALKIAYYRGTLAATLKLSGKRGAMVAVGCSASEVAPYFAQLTEQFGKCGVVVACINSSKSITVSGDEEQIDALEAIIKLQTTLFVRKLKVGIAYHSFHMESIAQEYLERMGELKAPFLESQKQKNTTMISSVTGSSVSAKELRRPEYWVANMVSPVRFSEAVSKLRVKSSKKIRKKLDGSHRLTPSIDSLLEIGPHSALQGPIRDVIQQQSTGASVSYNSLIVRNASAVETALTAAGNLYCLGVQLNFAQLNRADAIADTPGVLVDLPEYAFDHSKEYWQESRITKEARLRRRARNDLLGKPVVDWNPLEARWRGFIRESEMAWVGHHNINGSILYPAGGMLVMAIEAANQLADKTRSVTGFSIKDAVFHTALVVPQTPQGIETQFYMRAATESGWSEFTLYTNEGQYIEICHGFVRTEYAAISSLQYLTSDETLNIDGGREEREGTAQHLRMHSLAKSTCDKQVEPRDLYSGLQDCGYGFGKSFQPLTNIFYGTQEHSRADIALFQWPKEEYPQDHIIHPATLDGFLHMSLAGVTQGGSKQILTLVPMHLKSLWVASTGLSHPLQESVKALATPTTTSSSGMEVNVSVLDCFGSSVVAKVEGLRMSAVSTSTLSTISTAPAEFCHEISWKPDADLLPNDQLLNYCETMKSKDAEPVAFFQDLAFVNFVHILRVLEAVESSGTPSEPHMQKYVEWAKLQAHKFEEGILPHSQADWAERLLDSQHVENMITRVENANHQGKLYVEVGRALPKMLSGEIDPLQLLFETDLLKNGYYEVSKTTNCLPMFSRVLDSLAHKNPDMRYLEIGAGTGGTTESILDTLMPVNSKVPRCSLYEFTDISASFFEKAREIFGRHPGMAYNRLDIENDPANQGFEEESYDVIIAANVLHATKDIEITLKNVRKLLKPGGKLVLFEVTTPDLMRSGFMMGVLPGWWLSMEEYRPWGPCMTTGTWNEVLLNTGFTGVDLILPDFDNEVCQELSVMVASKPVAGIINVPSSVNLLRTHLVIDEHSAMQQAAASQIQRRLEVSSNCDIITLDSAASSFDMSDSILVFLQELERPMLKDISAEEFLGLQKLIGSAKGIVWLNSGGGSSRFAPQYGIVDGLSRVLHSERPELVFVTICLENAEGMLSGKQIDKIGTIFRSTDFNSAENDYEPMYLEQDGLLSVGRVVQAESLSEVVSQRSLPLQAGTTIIHSAPLRVTCETPGAIDTLHFVEDKAYLEALAPGEVEVRLQAIDISYENCMAALGQPRGDFQHQGAGIVSRVSEEAQSEFNVGDKVCMATGDGLRTFVRAQSARVCRIPEEMTLEKAACVPLTFVTAWQSVHGIARLEQGQTILIHSGASPIGQAAIQISLHLGAKVFVTVKTASEKNLIIGEFGIDESHIFYNGDDSFAKGIKRMTRNEGVDAVITDLQTEYLGASCSVVSPHGCVVDLAKSDSSQATSIPTVVFEKSITFSRFDVASWMKSKPTQVRRATRAVVDLLIAKSLHHSKTVRLHSVENLRTGIQLVCDKQGNDQHIISIEGSELVPTMLATKPTFSFDERQTFLIAGGFGGIGQSTARWMISRGARNLIILSRSGPRDDAAVSLVQELRGLGAHIEAPACDITNEVLLRSVLDDCAQRMPPVAGCIVASMVLNDSLFKSMSYDSWRSSTDVKITGSWNLHKLLPKGMDFFITLASVSGIAGLGGQANYAAGNTYADALAHFRKSQGEKAVSIDLGPMESDGFLADKQELMNRLIATSGLFSVSPKKYFALLEYYCNPQSPPTEPQSMIGLAMGDYAWRSSPFARFLRQQDQSTGPSASEDDAVGFQKRFVEAITTSDAAAIVSEAMVRKLAKNLSTMGGDEVDALKPMYTYGVDSLLAIDLRNWIMKEFKADVPIFEILGGSTLSSVSNAVAGKSQLRQVKEVVE